MKFALGQSIQRLEDDALLRGAGRYTDDFAPSGAAPPSSRSSYSSQSGTGQSPSRTDDAPPPASRTEPGEETDNLDVPPFLRRSR